MSNILTGRDMISALEGLEIGTPVLVDAGTGVVCVLCWRYFDKDGDRRR